MTHRILAVLVLCVATSFAVGADEATPDFPRVPATPPEKVGDTFRTLAGFRMELLAAEPLVTDPVAMAYDENGRAFVAEMNDYPYTDAATHQAWKDNTTDAPIGRIRLLIDTDGDGDFDRSTLFAENLSWPTGVACFKGGIFVAATPDVWYLKDTNGDGKADVRRKVYTGFRKFNVQAVMNNLAWGLDNCIYGAGGSNGGKVLPGEKPDAEPITLSRNDFRFDPVSERFEPIPGGARFGNAFDDWGNRFVCNIRNPAQHVLVESRYLARNPHVSVASVVHDVADSGDALPVYRVSPLEKWRDVRANRFAAERATQPRSELVGGGVVTSASGITVYRGDAYPPEFRGQLFIGEVANNLIHRQVMRPDGVTFASRRVDEKTDFVASTDVWFRPVNFVNAPDGTLHVLDMYREVIEHPWSIPDDIRAKLDLRSGADRGRIFRLAPQGFRAGKVPKLDDAATGELADTLRNPNSWWRETAQRLIFERQDREAVEPLQKLLADAKEPLARLHALWTLEGLGAAAEADILRAMNDAEPGVRENAIRVAERHLKGSTTLLDRLLKATEDAELRVRFQAVLTLGESADPRVVDALATVAKRDASDPWMTVAILSGSNGRGGELMGKLIADDAFATSAAGGVFLRQLAVSVGGANEPAEVSRVLASLATNEKTALSVASGLGEGLRRKSGTLRKAAEGDAAVSAALEKLFNSAAKTAADPKAAVADRVRATGLLAFEDFDRVKPLLNDLLDPRQPPELQRAAVAALSGSHDGAIGPLLLSRWASYTPAVRNDVMAAMLSYPNRLSPLLDAVEAGRVRVGDIPASRRAATTQHANEQIRTRALKLFGEDTKVERKQIIEKYTPALDLPGDPAAGRKTYQTLCATCHRLGDEGNDVGPNLATVRQWGPQQLLVNIVDPHREVAPGFAEYVVQLVDGETLSGIVTEESGTSITLKLAGGAQRVLPRQNVKLISGSRLSLMPEGLETGLSLQQMADLIALLRSAPQEQNKLSFDDQWTPKGHLGKGDLPEEKEADWIDGRSREMDFGPFVTTSLVVPELGVPRKPFVDRKTPGDERNALPGDERVVKALAIKLGGSGSEGRAGVLFDKTTMTLRCGWTGKFLEHSSLRYGLLEAPQIGGDLAFATVPDAWESGDAPGGTLPREWQGLYRNGRDVVLAYTVGGRTVRELNDVDGSGERAVFARTMEIGPGTTPLTLTIAKQDRRKTFVAATGAELSTRDGRTILSIPARNAPTPIRVFLSAAEIPDVTDAIAPLDRLNAPRQRIWGEPLVTKGQLGKPALGSPFAVDTITMPYDNPHKALFFAGGFDFAPDGSCYVCTAHGDVWRVTGIDEDLDEIRWQRFATGLYQPLGLKVRDGAVFVLGRDQVTRLHDANADGEADFYENVNDDCTDQGQPHAYAMCLETDAAGNFYFLKSGAPKTPHGGTLLKLSADGKELSVFATGFRHADGLSISPDGATITTADNEGNWVPVTRLDIVERGKFYGHVPTAHVTPEPTGPGEPLCWLPRVIDNSAGGQAWVPDGAWGSLSGALLHFSFGRCTANVILKEQVDGVWQGGAVVLPTGQFLSGVHRGRFVGNVLYLCGLNGWSSEAAKDGCFQRVRYVGGPIPLPTGVHVYANGIELTFAEPLDAKLAADPKRYAVEAWNYRWSREYGSKDYLPSDPTREGRATLNVTRAVPSSDGRSVFLTVERLAPVMQLRLQAGLRTAAGAALPVEYYGTIHRLRAARP